NAHVRFESLEGVRLAGLLAALAAAVPPSHDLRWIVTENTFDPDSLHHKETVFTTGNGYISTRGAFEEGYPGERSASFMHRLWDDVPIVLTELVNLPRWWGFRITINGERFRMDRGTVLSYSRWLDLRNGVLSRIVRWRLHDRTQVSIAFERFSSLADPHLSSVRVRIFG